MRIVLFDTKARKPSYIEIIAALLRLSRSGIIRLHMRADNAIQKEMNEAERLASEFLDSLQSSIYMREAIDRLARMATSPVENDVAQATKTLFSLLIERLADSFDPAAVSIYNRLMAQLIGHSRKTEQGRALDCELSRFELFTEDDLIARAEKLFNIRKPDWSQKARNRVKLLVMLSRVTIGADVAVTSVIIERLKREFPDAKIAFVGGGKASEIFGGDSRLSFHRVSYGRAGALLDRLLVWTSVLENVRHLTKDLAFDEYLIIDPDSRLTQLGLLPVACSEMIDYRSAQRDSTRDYLFFPSRSYGSDTRRSLGELTSLWLDGVFDYPLPLLPRVSLLQKDVELASEVVGRMRSGGANRLVAVNLGTGENPAKRLGDEFERLLVDGLIGQGATVILDKGFGEEEERRADAIIEYVSNQSGEGRWIRVVEVDEEKLRRLIALDDKLQIDMLVWRGRIGLFAALTGQSDLYTGYDSAFQHIAAAMGVPCIDVFAGFSSPRMTDRWRPTGRGRSQVIAVDTLNHPPDVDAILSQVLTFVSHM